MSEQPALASATLVYVAPRSGTSGVSDYADDMIAEARRHVREVIEIRHGGAGQDSLADVLRGRREIQRALRGATAPVILHTEHSGGVLLPFWGLTLRQTHAPGVTLSATLHDAPLGVWLPFRTRGVSRSRLLVHALHYPFMPLLRRLERRVFHGVRLSALTRSGAGAIREELGHDEIDVTFLPPPQRSAAPPAQARPLAVGLFGYVYRGKGFDLLQQLRAEIDANIAIRVAGRGTESLDPVDGVEILGPVEGASEDAFFASVRAIVLPYTKRSSYGPITHVASSVVARAIAYDTPVVALRYPGLSDEAEIVDGDAGDLAAAVNRLIPDGAEVTRMAARSTQLHAQLTVQEAFSRLAKGWQVAPRAAE